MTERLPRATAEQIAAVLLRQGFQLVRQSGSHRIYRSAQGRRATVPFHGAAVLHPKVLKSILRDAGLSVDELRQLMR